MNNYHYIIAGLPYLILDFETSGYDFDALFENLSKMSSPKDRRHMKWLYFGLKEENLSRHFYRETQKSKIKFIREYFAFDLELRNIQAAYIARKNSLDPSTYLIGDTLLTKQLKESNPPDFGISDSSKIYSEVIRILENDNILEREQMLDTLRWNKANEICQFIYFDINVILSFIVKASIVKRWNTLDKKGGALIFKQLVDEVRETFKPDNIINYI